MADLTQNGLNNEKLATLWRQLSWSHNRTIMDVNEHKIMIKSKRELL